MNVCEISMIRTKRLYEVRWGLEDGEDVSPMVYIRVYGPEFNSSNACIARYKIKRMCSNNFPEEHFRYAIAEEYSMMSGVYF